jgi:hypothetical protein
MLGRLHYVPGATHPDHEIHHALTGGGHEYPMALAPVLKIFSNTGLLNSPSRSGTEWTATRGPRH